MSAPNNIDAEVARTAEIAQIQEVNLDGCKAAFAEGKTWRDLQDDALVIQHGGAWRNLWILESQERSDKLLLIRYAFGVRVVRLSENEEPEVFAIMELSFVAEYVLDAPDVSKEAIEQFAQIVGLFHVWPFFREYAQDQARRMRWPDIRIPLYKMRFKEPKTGKTQSSADSETNVGQRVD